MYYRRKVLLALVEAFDLRLKRTDFQKLLFLFCQHTKQDHYDFFPYKYGGFSFLAYQDKERLTALGLLSRKDDFELCTDESFLEQLRWEDRAALNTLTQTLSDLRGKALIRKVYLDYPHYACRSEILTDVLTPEEVARLRTRFCRDYSPGLYTIGYEGLTIDACLDRLISNNIQAIVDVRKNPNSMKYGFSKGKLQDYAERAGIKYFHVPDLGIPSSLRQNLGSSEDYQRLFQHYLSQILPTRTEAIEEVRAVLSEYARVALLCFEADYRLCHRHKITEYLQNVPDFNVQIVHL